MNGTLLNLLWREETNDRMINSLDNENLLEINFFFSENIGFRKIIGVG
jgi:hypothetical protein